MLIIYRDISHILISTNTSIFFFYTRYNAFARVLKAKILKSHHSLLHSSVFPSNPVAAKQFLELIRSSLEYFQHVLPWEMYDDEHFLLISSDVFVTTARRPRFIVILGLVMIAECPHKIFSLYLIYVVIAFTVFHLQKNSV